jgi:hypothetical protein
VAASGCSLARDGRFVAEVDASQGIDVGTDAGGIDAGPGEDSGIDAGLDAGLDAGFDAGLDSGSDAGRYEIHVRECEDGRLVGAMMPGVDPLASDGAYVGSTPGFAAPWVWDPGAPALPPSRVEHDFVLRDGGTYYVWVRLFTVAGDQDAQYAGFSSALLRRFYHLTFGTWQWVGPTTTLAQFDGLAAGPQTLSIGPGEPGPRCDRIVVTNDPALDPATVP